MIKGEKNEKSKEEKTGIVNGGFYAFYERFWKREFECIR